MKKITPEIKSKLKKILALAETGLDGEKLLAKEKLTQLLVDYDLTLEDLQQEKIEKRIFKGVLSGKMNSVGDVEITFEGINNPRTHQSVKALSINSFFESKSIFKFFIFV